ncbi:hypothetical protein CSIRO_3652 [Bradyrhizobiaceae bacterium SG-6C]|nr:hypothetical protein CSIRO_3652 [Bradyrhizobiaceae bacterium SG-6C]
MHDTGPALGCVATHVGPGQMKMLAQELDEKRTRIDFSCHRITVHDQ